MAEDTKFEFVDGKFRNRVSGEEIPDDEPVFLFRARDVHAVSVLRFYQRITHDEHHWRAIQDCVEEFAKFATDHPDRMKEPGTTHHVRLKSDG